MFYIRADANPILGSGHVMRCLAIAEALRKRGQDTTFLTADNQAQVLFTQHGFLNINLNSAWDDLERETDSLKHLIEKMKISSLLIDSYYVSRKYLYETGRATKVIYVDDLNKFIYPVTALINYNVYAERLKLKDQYPATTKLLLGCQYAPLREEFIGKKHTVKAQVENVLISTGGADTFNAAGQIIQSIRERHDLDSLILHVVIGPLNHNKSILEDLTKQYSNIVLYQNVSDMSVLMVGSDIAVSAGGSTLYELCACGIPSISFSYADNQKAGTMEFDSQGFIFYAGDIRENMRQTLDKMIGRLQVLCQDGELRYELSCNMTGLVDGLGADRIAGQLLII